MRRGTMLSISIVATALGVVALVVLHGRSEAVQRFETGEPSAPSAAPTRAASGAMSTRFRVPSGKPARLGCDAAHAITSQTKRLLAYSAPAIRDDRAFADATLDWVDPHGLWAIAKKTPLGIALHERAQALIAELDVSHGAETRCSVARDLGRTLAQWITTLKDHVQRGKQQPFSNMNDAAFSLSQVDDAEGTAAKMGQSWAAFDALAGNDVSRHSVRAAEAFFPDLDEAAWSEVILAGAVRAFVMQTDTHSVWAPFDEEASISEVDLVADAPSLPWSHATMTPFGPELDGVAPPLEEKDVLIATGDVSAAGLSLEQLLQLGYSISESERDERLYVLRGGKVVVITMHPREEGVVRAGDPDELTIASVPYGRGHVAMIALTEVKDNLGELMRDAIRKMRAQGEPVGIVLDLRNNGGGSADGAQALLGHFLPRAPLFPTRRGDGVIDVEYAQDVEASDVWRGPVATLIDGDTASAGEMIAGALASYNRGPSIGTTSFGKGCEQEYLDDDAHLGVLKLTTLLYALPDGTPVQRTGLTPTMVLEWTHRASGERESHFESSAPAWSGPDIRGAAAVAAASSSRGEWPPTTHIGPCADEDVCRALTLLAGHAKRSARGRESAPRKK